ncbi:MAG: YggS family pyridoxal phosphate enzyme [Gammaproteobacteria bacterium RIFCSPLOWO2_02_FULL_42_14]|nr:MAG: YggS family pyridoxal phosphate enzyme [Gammaproteobacteria bacterium RIFCSPHIGHO2_02_FULL_42_43]OGT27693.1 MAG: YggS family pyridoxal phosphate enzyme [Gammaproteobacteria bacterium RIFCSPHIGHO2_01_FULL_42_8]OGT51358.1 MAG: YggS family pyridoxal phosphate enzyme [Gammaproteobacteria bacterium RIFCSPHIGHO2_12_FULL_41_25]OGT62060.1 MAG: YggS family pyridoxal phosphate enzyme [Gammaproteobacteria bacterium RIFCSPLOWO2_02_FULL_42_14]OGT85733.1 MAG: YggS family pyridoxal phosphate enzyme [G
MRFETLGQLVSDIRSAEKKYHRADHSVRLLVASKSQSSEKIRALYAQGQKIFGENYAQEAIEKQKTLSDLKIEWHFIGNIQSNKVNIIATHFDWVQSVNRFSIAEKLNHAALLKNKIINICLEVNIDASPTKSGIIPTELIETAKKISTLKQLKFRGIMVMPDPVQDQEQQYVLFKKAAELQQQLIDAGFSLDTLSMGMSSDFEMAIRAGSTLVRIGTAIFRAAITRAAITRE